MLKTFIPLIEIDNKECLVLKAMDTCQCKECKTRRNNEKSFMQYRLWVKCYGIYMEALRECGMLK